MYKRQPSKLADPELKAVHPLGKSPAITITAPALKEPLAIAESAVIFEYLCDHFAQHLVPKRYRDGLEGKVGGETEQWLRYRFYMHYAEGSLMSLLMIAMFMDSTFPPVPPPIPQIRCQKAKASHPPREAQITHIFKPPDIRNSPVPFFIKPVTRGIADKVDSFYLLDNYATHFSFLESQLASSPDNGQYLCGAEVTAADIMMTFPLMAAKSKLDAGKYPKLIAYIERLEKEPGYVGSVKKIEEVSGMPFKTIP